MWKHQPVCCRILVVSNTSLSFMFHIIHFHHVSCVILSKTARYVMHGTELPAKKMRMDGTLNVRRCFNDEACTQVVSVELGSIYRWHTNQTVTEPDAATKSSQNPKHDGRNRTDPERQCSSLLMTLRASWALTLTQPQHISKT